jgi:hypothetical protein
MGIKVDKKSDKKMSKPSKVDKKADKKAAKAVAVKPVSAKDVPAKAAVSFFWFYFLGGRVRHRSLIWFNPE